MFKESGLIELSVTVNTLDQAVYFWAVNQLNPHSSSEKILTHFAYLANCYNDQERFFHRGLGHPRALLPPATQQTLSLLLTNDHKERLEELIKQIDSTLSNELDLDRKKEAQEILAAFYHDVVHRNGKKPTILSKYVSFDGDNIFLIHAEETPLTASLLDDLNSNLKVEELSCIVAENAFYDLGLSTEQVIPILLSIIATIPFDIYSQPNNLQQRFQKAAALLGIKHSEEMTHSTIQQAIALSNRDLSSYGTDTLLEFDQKTWAMMYERNAAACSPDHTILDELDILSRFYSAHHQLLNRIEHDDFKIYESTEDNKEINNLNKNAYQLLKKDVPLLGMQLGSLVILACKTASKIKITLSVKDAVNNKSICELIEKLAHNTHYSHTIPPEIVEVLLNHGKKCLVNGIPIQHGSENGPLTLCLAQSIGINSLLKIADRFIDIQQRQKVTAKHFLTLSEDVDIILNQDNLSHKHYILNFDLNGTIMGPDKANGIHLDAAVSAMQSEDPRYKTEWQQGVVETHREFIDRHIHPGLSNDRALKKIRRKAYFNFLEDIKSVKHPLQAEIENENAELNEKLAKANLFDSFVKLIHFLQAKNISFTVILRTFGDDLDMIINEIHDKTSLRIEKQGKFIGDALFVSDDTTLRSPHDIYNLFKSSNCAIRDDWAHWNRHGEKSEYAKPFYFDKNPNIINFFFDDNVHKQIIKATPIYGEVPCQSFTLKQLIDRGLVVKVNTLEAARKNDYYINHINNVIENTPIPLVNHNDKSINPQQNQRIKYQALQSTLFGKRDNVENPESNILPVKTNIT